MSRLRLIAVAIAVVLLAAACNAGLTRYDHHGQSCNWTNDRYRVAVSVWRVKGASDVEEAARLHRACAAVANAEQTP